jgi:hypothetical protein
MLRLVVASKPSLAKIRRAPSSRSRRVAAESTSRGRPSALLMGALVMGVLRGIADI